MTEHIAPENLEQLQQVIAWAVSEERPFAIHGGRSKSDIGHPTNSLDTVQLSRLSGIVDYAPSELYITTAPGTPVFEIELELAARNQELAFEPPDLGPLLGGDSGRSTIGGVVACNLSGPRRIKAGAVRDHFLGVQAISGRGEEFKSGGRVMKNVTGYDLCKLLAGSYGTLAVMSELTVKVLPAAEETATLVVRGLSDSEAISLLSRALGTPYDISGAAHFPAQIASASEVVAVVNGGASATALRVEGPAPSVAYRLDALHRTVAVGLPTAELSRDESLAFWREVRDVKPFCSLADRYVWRLSVPPSEAARVAERILGQIDGSVYYDWGGGLMWLGLTPQADAGHEVVRAAAGEAGGHAVLVRASAATRASIPVFPPLEPAMERLAIRVKEAFDPRHILNRGRMFPDA